MSIILLGRYKTANMPLLMGGGVQVSYLDILSFVGYKYVSANVSLGFFIAFGSQAFWPLYIYTTLGMSHSITTGYRTHS